MLIASDASGDRKQRGGQAGHSVACPRPSSRRTRRGRTIIARKLIPLAYTTAMTSVEPGVTRRNFAALDQGSTSAVALPIAPEGDEDHAFGESPARELEDRGDGGGPDHTRRRGPEPQSAETLRCGRPGGTVLRRSMAAGTTRDASIGRTIDSGNEGASGTPQTVGAVAARHRSAGQELRGKSSLLATRTN